MSGDSDKTNGETASGTSEVEPAPQEAPQKAPQQATEEQTPSDAPASDAPSDDASSSGAPPAMKVSVAASGKRKASVKKSAAKKKSVKRAAGQPAQRKSGKRRVKAKPKSEKADAAPEANEADNDIGSDNENVKANGAGPAEKLPASKPRAARARKRKAVASKVSRHTANGSMRVKGAEEAKPGEVPAIEPAEASQTESAAAVDAEAASPVEPDTVVVPEPAPEPVPGPAPEPAVETEPLVAEAGMAQARGDAVALEQRPLVTSGEPAGTESADVEPAPRGLPWMTLLFIAVLVGAGYWLWQEHGSLIMRLAGFAPQQEVPPADAPLESAELAELESLLVQLGLEPGVVDGVVDEQTRQAISEFQELDELPVDGEPSPAVLEALREVAGFQETDG